MRIYTHPLSLFYIFPSGCDRSWKLWDTSRLVRSRHLFQSSFRRKLKTRNRKSKAHEAFEIRKVCLFPLSIRTRERLLYISDRDYGLFSGKRGSTRKTSFSEWLAPSSEESGKNASSTAATWDIFRAWNICVLNTNRLSLYQIHILFICAF